MLTIRGITPLTFELLQRLGEGYPSRIVQLSYEMSFEAFLEVRDTCAYVWV